MNKVSKALLIITFGGALGLIGSTALPGAGTAWAQTASDLKCKKCVDKGDIAKKAITKSRIKPGAVTGNRIKDGAVSETKLSPALQDTVASSAASVAERQSFYVTLDINLAEQTIATNGPLEYFVRCFINDGGSDRVEIIATSSVAGWYEEDNGSAALPALQEEIILSNSNPTGDDDYENEIDDGSMVGPDGSYMAVDGETVGLGLNIFGHRCVAVGHVIKVNGTL